MRMLFFLTNFGDPFLTIPLAATVLCWFVGTHRWRAALCWAGGFACGTGAVALSKLAYAGWGIGIDALDFTGASGHTMLGAAVYPVVCAIGASRANQTTARLGACVGLAFALAIGLSRVLGGFHSWSEVVSGWLIGAGVAVLTLYAGALTRPDPRSAPGAHASVAPPRGLAPFTVAALIIVLVCHGRIAPLSDWIADAAPRLSEWSGTLYHGAR